ncbi:MAG TPA: hypothetical protein VGC99_11955 [Candidatus Tectomicrobia bacterium]
MADTKIAAALDRLAGAILPTLRCKPLQDGDFGMSFERTEMKRRLVAGESLEVSTGGGSYEVWAEPYANPPAVFYEGRPLPYTQLDEVLGGLINALERGEVQCRWVESSGIQAKACQEAHRQRAVSGSN